MNTLQLRVTSVTYEAEGINSYELRAIDDAGLPSFAAGAHIDVWLPGDLVRSYSLINPQDECDRYVIAVSKDANSRGASRFMHESLRVGTVLTAAPPRNNFPMNERCESAVFVAGGIGITPILAMLRRCGKLNIRWTLYYCARTKEHAAFIPEIHSLATQGGNSVHLNFDQEPGGKILDIGGVLADISSDTHIYCCGPLPMLRAFEGATRGRRAETVHVEYFSARQPVAAVGGFTVELSRAKKNFFVPAGKTILDVLLEAGIDAPYSCREGVCSTCETRVLEGEPDHRDVVLSPVEHASNRSMMICCSGSKTKKLVLDL
ncbi:PDR/VanB family oxidoreductase [Paraburkholderia silvatlantica]|uniref:PDR/VanB family oxidoreductase n=1 Tax=Paraburkholderia silvatlantica TaxID=321895 RepID=UPI00374FDED7